MKARFLLVLALLPVASFGAGIHIGGSEIIRIDDDSDLVIEANGAASLANLRRENRILYRRIARLEAAVRQLQSKTFNLEMNAAENSVGNVVGSALQAFAKPIAAKEFTCYLQTTFEGTVMGKGGSEAEAKANTLQACDKKNGGFSCRADKVQCS